MKRHNHPRSAIWGGLYQQVKDAQGNRDQRRKARKAAVERAMKMLAGKDGKFSLEAVFGIRGDAPTPRCHGKAPTKPHRKARGRFVFRARHGARKTLKRAQRPEKRLIRGEWVLFGWSEAKGAMIPMSRKEAWDNSIQCPMVGDRRYR